MRIILTDMTIRNLRPPAKGQRTYLDKKLGGFGVRVSQGGTKTFTLMHGPNRELTTIGRVGVVSLAQARERAKDILAEEQLGIRRPKSPYFEAAMEDFLAKHCEVRNRASTAAETERLLRKHFLPPLRRFSLDEITSRRIGGILDDLSGTPSTARHAFTALRTFFRWSIKRGLLASSPIALMDVPPSGASRERILTNTELVAVWRAADEMGYPFGTIVQLLILTGARRGEIGGLRKEWLKRDRIELPAEIMKAKKPHTIPLTTMSESLIAAIPVEGGFLFPARRRGDCQPGGRSFSGWSKDKAILEARINPSLLRWGLHDLRRTASTRWAELGIAPHVNDMLLAHTIQGVSAVHRVYNLATYLEPMHEALEKWQAYIQALLSNTEGSHHLLRDSEGKTGIHDEAVPSAAATAGCHPEPATRL